MLLATFVTGRKHTALQYTAALVMGFGLAVLTAADIFGSSNSITSGTNRGLKLATNLNIGVGSIGNHGIGELVDSKTIIHFIGPILLLISTFFDSVVPNLQEQLLQTAKVKTSELIFVSNAMMCFVLLIYTTYSGELMDAWVYCIQHKDALGVLLLQGVCAYLGLQCYLTIIQEHGGVAGVLLANGRKIVTIILSFVLFSKPFNARHFVGLVLVFVGVYLGYVSKKVETKRSKASKRRKKSESDQSHEHYV